VSVIGGILVFIGRNEYVISHFLLNTVDQLHVDTLMFIGPCIIAIVDE